MKKFNLYVNGSRYDIVSSSEPLIDFSHEVKEEVDKLKLGESYIYTTNNSKTNWEIERVL